MRTELQYNLQKARALATELRCTLEAIDEIEDIQVQDQAVEWSGESSGIQHYVEEVGQLEHALDNFAAPVIGTGSVALTIAPFEEQSND